MLFTFLVPENRKSHIRPSDEEEDGEVPSKMIKLADDVRPDAVESNDVNRDYVVGNESVSDVDLEDDEVANDDFAMGLDHVGKIGVRPR